MVRARLFSSEVRTIGESLANLKLTRLNARQPQCRDLVIRMGSRSGHEEIMRGTRTEDSVARTSNIKVHGH